MWVCYKIYLEAKAPIHIGYGAKLGVVDKTRYYIPAKNVWGALTNLIAKNVMINYSPKLYQEIGKEFDNNIKFSYLYPIEYKKYKRNNIVEIEVKQIFAPLYTEEGLKFGVCKGGKKISLEEFEKVFISSFISTAIDKGSKSAEEGSLHEIEFLRDKVKFGQNEELKPTVFLGYLFVKSSPLKIFDKKVEISFEKECIKINETKLSEIWIGGERNYGFGRVKIIKIHEENFKDGIIDLFNSEVKIDITKEQLIVFSKDKQIIAISHVDIKNLDAKLIKGDIEPLVGREWGEKGSGQKISQTAQICITPGSWFICDKEIIIGNFGIWQAT